MPAENVTRSVFYICPNECKDAWFFQGGTATAGIQLDAEGKVFEREYYDFTPTGPVRCRHCNAEAISKTKEVTMITRIV